MARLPVQGEAGLEWDPVYTHTHTLGWGGAERHWEVCSIQKRPCDYGSRELASWLVRAIPSCKQQELVSHQRASEGEWTSFCCFEIGYHYVASVALMLPCRDQSDHKLAIFLWLLLGLYTSTMLSQSLCFLRQGLFSPGWHWTFNPSAPASAGIISMHHQTQLILLLYALKFEIMFWKSQRTKTNS